MGEVAGFAVLPVSFCLAPPRDRQQVGSKAARRVSEEFRLVDDLMRSSR